MSGAAAPVPVASAVAITVAALLSAVVFGLLTSLRTEELLIVLAVVGVSAISLFAPLGTLALLLFLAVLIPFPEQNRFAVVGGTGVPGILVIDLLLILSLARVTVSDLASRRSPTVYTVVAYGLLFVAALQLVHGLVSGSRAGDAGTEARHVAVAIASFLLAVPVLANPVRRGRVPAVLLGLALAVGLSGLAQWILKVPFNAVDFGVRGGDFGTSSGRGQLQGGLYIYPVVVVLAFAGLIHGGITRPWARALTVVALTLNVVCLLVTYERTFWLATALGCALVLLRSPAAARRRALVLGPAGLVALLAVLVVVSPTSLQTALERGTSVSDTESEMSGQYRVVEAQEVLKLISARPIDGSGFGARMTWEPPDSGGVTLTEGFVHNGYLWLAWKLGILVAAVWVGLIVISLLRRLSPSDGDLIRGLRTGAQASLLVLLLVNLTFASFNSLSIAAITGPLLALCWMPRGVNSG